MLLSTIVDSNHINNAESQTNGSDFLFCIQFNSKKERSVTEKTAVVHYNMISKGNIV